MTQMARNAVDGTSDCLRQHRYRLHDRDAKFCRAFAGVLRSSGIRCLTLPARSPNLNAFGSAGCARLKRNASANSSCSAKLRWNVPGENSSLIFIPNEITKARVIDYCFLPRRGRQRPRAEASTARNALAVCFDTTLVLLDYLTKRESRTLCDPHARSGAGCGAAGRILRVKLRRQYLPGSSITAALALPAAQSKGCFSLALP
jgi:hypothetical protein